MRRQLVAIALSVLAAPGCVSQAVKDAVAAYSTAVGQVAESGQADVAQCQNQQDAALKQQFCDKAKKQFQTVRDSAAQLQNIK